jgi:hypothetical protein
LQESRRKLSNFVEIGAQPSSFFGFSICYKEEKGQAWQAILPFFAVDRQKRRERTFSPLLIHRECFWCNRNRS